MMTIDDYMDRAKATARIPSDNELARRLGLTSPTVSAWRMKRQWPKDNHMVGLADLAGVDRLEALADLGAWRTDGEARACYHQIARKLSGAILSALILLPFGNQVAAERVSNKVTSKLPEVSIMRQRRRRRSPWTWLNPLPQ